jgi:hypothetical protein
MDFRISLNENSINVQLIAIIVVAIIIQYWYIAKKSDSHANKKLNDRINFNLSNQNEVEQTITTELRDRLKLLKTSEDDPNDKTKMEYNDWCQYNTDSPFIFVNREQDIKYFIQTWRLVPNTDYQHFKLRTYPDTKLLNHSWTDLYNFILTVFTSNHVQPEKDLIKIWYLLKGKPLSVFQFYWYDPIFDSVVERKEIILNYDDGYGNAGTFSAGYTLRNINETYKFNHFQTKNNKIREIYIASVIMTVFLTLVIYIFNKDNQKLAFIKALLFFGIFMTYIGYYMSLDDELGSAEVELKKLDSINQGILSMSFMTGLSIFILTNIKQTKDFLYRETSFLLIVYMIAIILILFKNNAYIKLRDITNHRVFKEFIFNYCILINMFIIINFGINVFLYTAIGTNEIGTNEIGTN